MYILIQNFAAYSNNSINLSSSQKELRLNLKKYIHDIKDTKICNCCFKRQPFTTNFYKHKQMKDGYLNQCKDCYLKRTGVLNVGKNRFSKYIFEKGLQRCSCCKEIKVLLEFSGNENKRRRVGDVCKECHKILLRKSRSKLSDNYIISLLLKEKNSAYNDREEISQLAIEEKRKLILERKNRIFEIDDKALKFSDFIKYMKMTYQISPNTTRLYIWRGTSFDKLIEKRKQELGL